MIAYLGDENEVTEPKDNIRNKEAITRPSAHLSAPQGLVSEPATTAVHDNVMALTCLCNSIEQGGQLSARQSLQVTLSNQI